MVTRVVDSGSLTAIQPAEGQIDDVVQSLRKMEHVTVYRKEEVPDYFYYKNNLRVMPVLVLADEGWEVTTVSESQMKRKHAYTYLFYTHLQIVTHIYTHICAIV